MQDTDNTRRDAHGLPHIDADQRYTTEESAKLLGQTPTLLRQWRMKGQGPKYLQTPVRGSKVQYLGKWLIAFREASIVEPVK